MTDFFNSGPRAQQPHQQHHPYHASNPASVPASHLSDVQGSHDAVYPPYQRVDGSMMPNTDGSILTAEGIAQESYMASGIPHHGMDAAMQEHALFMPLPQAPRLPVAAARASNLAAMYYDPTLHPQHVYNYNAAPSVAPWAMGYVGNFNAVNGAGGGAFNQPNMIPEVAPPMVSSTTAAPFPYSTLHQTGQEVHLHEQDPSKGSHAHQKGRQSGASGYAVPAFDPSVGRAQSVPGHMMPPSAGYQAYPVDGNVTAAVASNAHPSSHVQSGYLYNRAWDGSRWGGVDQASYSFGLPPPQRHSYAGSHDRQAAPSAALDQTIGYHPGNGRGAGAAGAQNIGANSGAHSGDPWQKEQFVSGERCQQWDVQQPVAVQIHPQPQYHQHQHQHHVHHQNSNKQYSNHHHHHHPPHPQHAAYSRQQALSQASAAHLSHRAAVEGATWSWSHANFNDESGFWSARSGLYPGQQHPHWQPSEQIAFMPSTLAGPISTVQATDSMPTRVDETQHAVAARPATTFGQQSDNRPVAGAQQPAEANAPANPSAPAPPSPDTLDKSAVPISSVGAEIMWIAAAALLDPSLWLSMQDVQRNHSSNGVPRKRLASPSSSSNASPLATPFTSPYNPSNDGWRRSSASTEHNSHAAAMARAGLAPRPAGPDAYDESSASSSEPGTPPASIAQHLSEKRDGGLHHEKRISMSALHGMRALGLSAAKEDGREFEQHHDRRSASPMDLQSPRSRSFRRSDSYDRSRESVTSVSGLLQSDWRWSTNDDKLDSLHHVRRGVDCEGAVLERMSMPVAPLMSRRLSSQSRFSPVRDDHSSLSSTGLAMSGAEASPAFRRFTHQVLAQTLVSPTAFMLGLMYSLRVLHLAVTVDRATGKTYTDPEALEIFAQPPSAAPFKLFTLGLMIANKHLDDNTFLNKTWNEVTGISLVDLNRAERWYLEKCSYEITVPEDTWIAFLERLHTRTEQRIARLNSAKRMRVPTNEAPDAPRKRSDSYVVRHAGSEEAHKRFLLCAEEALQALGRSSTFSLNGLQDHGAALHTTANVGAVRPKTSLTQLHQQCHSAPAVSNSCREEEGEVDVFEEEDGPYRPYGSSSKRSSAQRLDTASVRTLNASDALLNRSSSDSLAPTLGSCAREQQRARSKCDSAGQIHAPLAPSVLLELLNKGQQFAHAAH